MREESIQDPAVKSRWKRRSSVEARRTILDAAAEVFSERGYAETSIAAVLERSGISVGSIYHHFGGKSGLYLALWQEHHAQLNEAVATAVADARRRGTTDATELFVAGSKAYLQGVWKRRQLERLFLEQDHPPEFTAVNRATGQDWMRQNRVLLASDNTPAGRLTTAVLTDIIKSASREIVTSPGKPDAEAMVDTAIRLMRKLMAP